MVSCVGVHAASQEAYEPEMPVGLQGDMASVPVRWVWDALGLAADTSQPGAWTPGAAGPFSQQQQTKLCPFHPSPCPSCPLPSLEQATCSMGNLLSIFGPSLWSQHDFSVLLWERNEEWDFCLLV